MSKVTGIRVSMREMMKEVSSKDEDNISLLTAELYVRRSNYATANRN